MARTLSSVLLENSILKHSLGHWPEFCNETTLSAVSLDCASWAYSMCVMAIKPHLAYISYTCL